MLGNCLTRRNNNQVWTSKMLILLQRAKLKGWLNPGLSLSTIAKFLIKLKMNDGWIFYWLLITAIGKLWRFLLNFNFCQFRPKFNFENQIKENMQTKQNSRLEVDQGKKKSESTLSKWNCWKFRALLFSCQQSTSRDSNPVEWWCYLMMRAI